MKINKFEHFTIGLKPCPEDAQNKNDAYGAGYHRFLTFMRLVLFDATERVCRHEFNL